jgi:hypothetical protein
MHLLALAIALLFAFGESAKAFCGFYVARADTTMLNHASKVVLARSGDRTVLTMASDVRGDPKEFAIVIPVPTVIQREQIRIARPQRSTISMPIPRRVSSNIGTRTPALALAPARS